MRDVAALGFEPHRQTDQDDNGRKQSRQAAVIHDDLPSTLDLCLQPDHASKDQR
jgi:hypothetical protein